MQDDVIYVIILVSSILLGPVYMRLPAGATRVNAGTIVGMAIVLTVAGAHVLHLCLLLAINLAIIRLAPVRRWHGLSMLGSFSYLLFFRTVSELGLPAASGHFNAVMMIATLKLVGLCGEMSDTVTHKEKLRLVARDTVSGGTDKRDTGVASDDITSDDTGVRRRHAGNDAVKNGQEDTAKNGQEDTEKNGNGEMKTMSADHQLIKNEVSQLELKLKYQGIEPSMLDIIHYTFSYSGILTGPYYKYRTWSDATLAKQCPTAWSSCLMRLRIVPVYAALGLIVSHYAPLKYAESHVIFSRSLLYRLAYMTPVFFAYRMRLYAGFILSECVCVASGLGAYPTATEARPGHGPTVLAEMESDSPATFKTVHNIDEWKADFGPSVREGMRGWNMTVQYWLVTNVYKRVQLPRAAKEALTMLVSAFWHGMHSGYYLSMMTVPLILMVEDYYARLIRKRLVGSKIGLKVYDAIGWFMKMQWFAYMGMAFLLLRVSPTLHYWRSIGYLGHCALLLLYTVAQFIQLVLGKAEQKLRRARNTAFGAHSKLQVKKTH